MSKDHNKYIGTGVGLLLGDIHGAPYEGGPLERGLWRIIGSSKGKQRYTDDSQMAFDLGKHLLKVSHIDQQELAIDFANSYKWSRGYGPSTVAVLKQIKKGKDWKSAATHRYKDGSFGNGAAMRIPLMSVFLHGRSCIEEIIEWTMQASEVTHPNPKAIDGAVAIALCVNNALDNTSIKENIECIISHIQTDEMQVNMNKIKNWIFFNSQPSMTQLKKIIGTGTPAIESCPVAIYLSLMCIHNSFEDLIKCIKACGGDTDTIGAMSGAIWGAYNGYESFPPGLIKISEGIEDMKELIINLRKNHPTLRRSQSVKE